MVGGAIPKGVFYGVINTELLGDDVPEELLTQFIDTLARGKIAAQGDSQGIRPVHGELAHDSQYLFKINLHAEDLRLFGRKIASVAQMSGQVKVLIEFDRVLGHKEALTYQCQAYMKA